jgi:hypothetical protein
MLSKILPQTALVRLSPLYLKIVRWLCGVLPFALLHVWISALHPEQDVTVIEDRRGRDILIKVSRIK